MRAGRLILSVAALLAWCLPSQAQFTTEGEDPGSLKWNQKVSANYRLIYPKSIGDSLPSLYSTLLEKYRPVVAKSIGMTPCDLQWGRLPVVLHPYNINSNGVVVWAPKRMALYPVQQSTPDSALPGSTELVIHESRHVAQMQFSYRGAFNWLNYVLGEMWSGALDGIYPDPALLEGDAVVAETALTSSGRGRSAEFLEYYRYALAHDDYRNYWRWRFGSNRLFTPDQYRVGYISVAGMRAFYDAPDFSARFYKHIHDHHGWSIYPFEKTVRSISGKDFRSTFAAISDTLGRIWSAEADSRAPYTPACQLTATEKNFTAYAGTVYADGALYSVRSGMADAHTLVKIDRKGRVTRIGPFASSTSRLSYDPEAANTGISPPARASTTRPRTAPA